MRWQDTDLGLEFESVRVRDFVIDALQTSHVFDELSGNFSAQKHTPENLLRLPPEYIKDVGYYLSLYERAFDRELANPTGHPISPISQPSPLAGWVRYWMGSLSRIQHEI